MFKQGDIVLARINNGSIIGRVLSYDKGTSTITFDIAIVGSDIKTGVIEIFDLGFELAKPLVAQDFTNFINTLPATKKIDKTFIKFVDLFNKANIETKYKIIKYILVSDLNN
jgi:hypothetical protein